MKVIDFNQSNSVLNRFVAELRDVNIQGSVSAATWNASAR